MPEDTTRWTVSVSKDTDIAVRSFLAQRGLQRVFLVTGDKRDPLGLRLYEGTRIVTVRDFLTSNRRLP
ncbi:MAG TPA: ribbon-helix-helix domain-containing protein [Stellaceae bacterium]|nr:ribbon-helix-helix domain-containing protein [Stellaceae bacterium]